MEKCYYGKLTLHIKVLKNALVIAALSVLAVAVVVSCPDWDSKSGRYNYGWGGRQQQQMQAAQGSDIMEVVVVETVEEGKVETAQQV